MVEQIIKRWQEIKKHCKGKSDHLRFDAHPEAMKGFESDFKSITSHSLKHFLPNFAA
jgi:hypothetical protein